MRSADEQMQQSAVYRDTKENCVSDRSTPPPRQDASTQKASADYWTCRSLMPLWSCPVNWPNWENGNSKILGWSTFPPSRVFRLSDRMHLQRMRPQHLGWLLDVGSGLVVSSKKRGRRGEVRCMFHEWQKCEGSKPEFARWALDQPNLQRPWRTRLGQLEYRSSDPTKKVWDYVGRGGAQEHRPVKRGPQSLPLDPSPFGIEC